MIHCPLIVPMSRSAFPFSRLTHAQMPTGPPAWVLSAPLFHATFRSITVDGGHSLVGEPDFILMAEKGLS